MKTLENENSATFFPPEDSHIGFLPPTPCSLRIQPRGNQLHAWDLPSVFHRLYWFPFSPGPASTSTNLGNSTSCLYPRGYRSQSPFPLSESPSSSLSQQFFAAFEGMVSIFYPGFFFFQLFSTGSNFATSYSWQSLNVTFLNSPSYKSKHSCASHLQMSPTRQWMWTWANFRR